MGSTIPVQLHIGNPGRIHHTMAVINFYMDKLNSQHDSQVFKDVLGVLQAIHNELKGKKTPIFDSEVDDRNITISFARWYMSHGIQRTHESIEHSYELFKRENWPYVKDDHI